MTLTKAKARLWHVYSTGGTYDCQLRSSFTIVICPYYRPQVVLETSAFNLYLYSLVNSQNPKRSRESIGLRLGSTQKLNTNKPWLQVACSASSAHFPTSPTGCPTTPSSTSPSSARCKSYKTFFLRRWRETKNVQVFVPESLSCLA